MHWFWRATAPSTNAPVEMWSSNRRLFVIVYALIGGSFGFLVAFAIAIAIGLGSEPALWKDVLFYGALAAAIASPLLLGGSFWLRSPILIAVSILNLFLAGFSTIEVMQCLGRF